MQYEDYYRKEHVYREPIRDREELKQRLMNMWVDVKQSVVDKAIEQCRRRLQSVLRDDILSICCNAIIYYYCCKLLNKLYKNTS